MPAKKATQPAKKQRGRPSLGDGPTKTMNIRMTEGQHAKFIKLGGAEWVRDRIDKAKLKSEG